MIPYAGDNESVIKLRLVNVGDQSPYEWRKALGGETMSNRPRKFKEELPLFHGENVAERPVDESAKHPTPEVLLIREAIKYLTPKQRKVWEYHAYDKLTQDEIAHKLKIGQPRVAKHIQAAEKRITKWCKSNMGAYELLKSDFEAME